MRNTLILAFGLVVAGASAQCPTLDTAAVVTVDSVCAADLHARARKWFATTFNSGKDVIQMDDAANATIIGKGSHLLDGGRARLKFTIEIACKDGRYRMSISGLEHEGVGGDMIGKKYWPSTSLGRVYNCDICADYYREHPQPDARYCIYTLLPWAHRELHDLAVSIQSGMASPTSATKDW